MPQRLSRRYPVYSLCALLAKSAAEAVASWRSEVGPEGASLLAKIGR